MKRSFEVLRTFWPNPRRWVRMWAATILLVASACVGAEVQTSAQVEDARPPPLTPNLIKSLPRVDGLVLFGDMLLTEGQAKRVVDGAKTGFTGGMWPGANVYYYFDADISSYRRAQFRGTIAAWSAGAGVAFFESETAENRIRVHQDGVGCNAGVGMQGGTQSINLNDVGCWNTRTIQHEMGHALGLMHEQMRTDRGAFVTVATTGGISDHCIALIAANWGTEPGGYLTAYDFASIMHYRSTSTLKSSDCDTGVSGTITAIAAQPPGAPAGSEAACLTPAACTTLMGASTLSPRDRHGMALRYGYRATVSVAGNGGGSVAVSGASASCGTNCYLIAPGSPFSLAIVPNAESYFSGVSGASCAGQNCTWTMNANAVVNVHFTRKATVHALLMGEALLSILDDIFGNGFD